MTIQFLISSASLWELVSPLKKKQLKHCLHYNSYLYTIHYKVKPAHFSSSIKVHHSRFANRKFYLTNSTFQNMAQPKSGKQLEISLEMRQYPQRVCKCNAYHRASSDYSLTNVKVERLFSRMNRWKTFYEVVLPARDWKLSYKSESGLLISRF